MPTDPELTLRRAEPEDAEALADLYSAARVAAVPQMPPALHTNAEDRQWMAGQLARVDHEGWLAEHDGRVIGYALITPTWLDHLFVHPEHLGSGTGAVLLDLVKSLRPDGFALWVFESNEGARRFYARHGLVELERTDGSGNEERAPDVRMAWPGAEPLRFYRGLIDEVDEQLGDLLARRVALTRAVQRIKHDTSRDAGREREIAAALARRAPELGEERLARIVHTIITESLEAAREGGVGAHGG
ncbi:GNAT family N-acetyltransferase [Nocardioides soli]|uniref:Chorismate mutase/GNAT superfamily N-acetyltransferase n=1 Tax=Nocardioides soli TaxID=1036020 RepID=A0A7W4VR97_9ACTN|nr:GNAT family N-acetyltransferase [Nocardioides soli]MBB3040315.1 chorismate mutase/GNAT superfamily N-acetyltransferase [Nocardioides soli]